MLVVATGCFSKPELHTGDAGSDAGVESLLRNGDFEQGCSIWQEYESEISTEVPGRSGGACRVCVTNSAYYYIRQRIDGPFEIGQQYVASAWIRETELPNHPVGIVLEVTNTSDVTVDYADGAERALTNEWKEVTTQLELTSPSGVTMFMRVGASFAAGESCFLIDDATLRRL
jgi:hypothetical protein